MKKTFLTAAFAALALGAAQAVTIEWDWTSSPTLPTGDIKGNIYTSGSNDKEVYLKVSSAPSSAVSAISIASCENALNSSVDFTDVYLSIRNASGSEVAKSLLVVTADAEYSSTTNGSGDGKVLQFAFTKEVSLQAGFTLHVVDSAGTPVNFVIAVTNTAGAGTSGVTVMQGTSEKTGWAPYVGYGTATITNIPEPTALALLALGVAGVALRRRVA